MENASKALLIAGAILLSILIIALGIYVFNLARSSMNTNQLNEMEVSAFNTQFTQYEGKQLGSNVKSLLDKVITSNNSNKDAEEKLIDVVCEAVKGDEKTIEPEVGELKNSDISAVRKSVAASHNYDVTIDTSADTGLVNKVTIKY